MGLQIGLPGPIRGGGVSGAGSEGPGGAAARCESVERPVRVAIVWLGRSTDIGNWIMFFRIVVVVSSTGSWIAA